MIEIKRSLSPADFLADVGGTLAVSEAENCLLLGFAMDLETYPPATDASFRFWTARFENQWVGAFFSDPPFPSVVMKAPVQVIEEWLDSVDAEGHPLSGVSAVPKTAEAVARDWCHRKGMRFRLTLDLSLYRMEGIPSGKAAPGNVRKAEQGDLELLADWTGAFNVETGVEKAMESRSLLEGYLKRGRLFVWDDGGPVCMAGFSGPTSTGIRLNLVYTPPEKRGHGYAQALTSAAVRDLSALGHRNCFLFADKGNPASNAVYKRVGFKPVTDWWVLKFMP